MIGAKKPKPFFEGPLFGERRITPVTLLQRKGYNLTAYPMLESNLCCLTASIHVTWKKDAQKMATIWYWARRDQKGIWYVASRGVNFGNPNDLCFDGKIPSFGGFKHQRTQQAPGTWWLTAWKANGIHWLVSSKKCESQECRDLKLLGTKSISLHWNCNLV